MPRIAIANRESKVGDHIPTYDVGCSGGLKLNHVHIGIHARPPCKRFSLVRIWVTTPRVRVTPGLRGTRRGHALYIYACVCACACVCDALQS